MDFTFWPRMLHSQPTGSTEIRTRDLRIQSRAIYSVQRLSLP